MDKTIKVKSQIIRANYDKSVLNKIDLLKKNKELVTIISDFDATITRAYYNNEKIESSFGVVMKGKKDCLEFHKDIISLQEKYIPIQLSTSIGDDIKSENMREWTLKTFEVFLNHKVTKSDIQKVIDENFLQVRDYFTDFLYLIETYKIPFLIVSAGFGDVVKSFMDIHLNEKISAQIISNFGIFNENDEFSGVDGYVIHPFNKHHIVKIEKDKNKIPYAIIIGDNISDINVGVDNLDNTLTIGFFNIKKQNPNYLELRKKFYDAFDIVIEDDGTFETVIDLLNLIYG